MEPPAGLEPASIRITSATFYQLNYGGIKREGGEIFGSTQISSKLLTSYTIGCFGLN